MNYKEMLEGLKSGYPTTLAKRVGWLEPTDKIAYSFATGMLEKREKGRWIPYTPNEEDGIATDWELVSAYI